MAKFRLKNFLPKSLMGRSVLILVVPIIVIQLVVGFFFLDRLFGNVSRSKTIEVANQVNFFLNNPNNVTIQALNDAGQNLGIRFSENRSNARSDVKAFDDISGRYVIDALYNTIPNVQFVDLLTDNDWVRVGIDAKQGPVLAEFRRTRASARNPHQLLVAMALASLLMTAAAIYFLRIQIKPIRLLARSAEAFGKGRNIPFQPRGAVEVRAAGNAFIAMRDRLERQIEQRTMMLSGVSHDLRTPLTRMSLSLSMLPQSEETEDIERDIKDMTGILNEFLAFSRGDGAEVRVTVNIRAFSEQVVRNFERAGTAVEFVYDAPEDASRHLNCRKTALTRAVNNLIGNAIRYGNTQRFTVKVHTASVGFIIEDDGPGIPEEAYDQALRPFIRLDAARNQDQGMGAGLGLAITADVARGHGGNLMLAQSPDMGGLRAEIRLPL